MCMHKAPTYGGQPWGNSRSLDSLIYSSSLQTGVMTKSSQKKKRRSNKLRSLWMSRNQLIKEQTSVTHANLLLNCGATRTVSTPAICVHHTIHTLGPFQEGCSCNGSGNVSKRADDGLPSWRIRGEPLTGWHSDAAGRNPHRQYRHYLTNFTLQRSARHTWYPDLTKLKGTCQSMRCWYIGTFG